MSNALTGVFSCRSDGSDGRVFGLIGAANPVEVTFTDEGEPLGTVAVYMYGDKGRDDAVMHWVPGVIGIGNTRPYDTSKPPLTGELPEPLSRRGHSAPSGIVRYRSGSFGAEYLNNLFFAEFNTHAVVRLTTERSGATFRQVASQPFVTSDNPDVHFTDVLEDADGSLLVIDTGRWYRHGCPTSSIDQELIPGAIYRVRRRNDQPRGDSWGLDISWKRLTINELIHLLDDDRFAVRDRAIDQLSQRGDEPLDELAGILKTGTVRSRRNALWTLCRIGSPSARAAIVKATYDQDLSVRLTAARCLSTVAEPTASNRLLQVLATDEPAVRRETASALVRIGDSAAVPPILASFHAPLERHLEHVLINALIELDCRELTVVGLSDSHPATQRAALIALDKMAHGELSPQQVTPLLGATDAALKQSAIDVIRRRGWSEQILELARQWISAPSLDDEQVSLLRSMLAGFLDRKEVSSLVVELLMNRDIPAGHRVVLLEAMAAAAVNPVPTEWVNPLAKALDDTDSAVVLAAVTVIQNQDFRQFDQQLTEIARTQGLPAPLRLVALAVVVGRLGEFDGRLFEFAIGYLTKVDEEGNSLERMAAARILGAASLSHDQLAALLDVVPQTTPLELPLVLPAFLTTKDDDLGRKLVIALEHSSAAWSVSEHSLTKVLGQFSNEVQVAGEPLLSRLRGDQKERQRQLDELRPLLAGGDVQHGQQVFFSSKASCTACHRALGRGAGIGPDLSRIGDIRRPADLLESIVFPSATIVQGFEPRTITTVSGKVYTGILARQTADVVFLRTADRAEVRIPRTDIETLTASSVSIMPQGLHKTLTSDELRDLLSFLASLK